MNTYRIDQLADDLAQLLTPNIDLGRFGVFTWDPGSSFLDLGLAVTPGQAQEIERLGSARYGLLVRRSPNYRSPTRFWSPPPR
jgi:hypothetical protein